MLARLVTVYQVVLGVTAAALTVLAVVPWESLVALTPRVRLDPGLLPFAVLALGLLVVDVVSGFLARLLAQPARRSLTLASIALLLLGAASLAASVKTLNYTSMILGAPCIVLGTLFLRRLHAVSLAEPEEPRGRLRYVVPAVLGLTGVGERLAQLLGIFIAAEKAGLSLSRLEVAATTALLLLAALSAAAVIAALAPPAGLPLHMALGLSAAALSLPAAYKLHLELRARERARQCEEELPYLALWAWLLERGGAGLEDALREARRSGLLQALGGDADRDLERLAVLHPSRRIRRFYSHYLAVRSVGGNVAEFLGHTVLTEVDELRARIEAYAENGVATGTGILGVVAVTLVYALFASFLGGPLHVAFIALLFAAPLGYLVLALQQPRLRESYSESAGVAAGLAAATLAFIALGHAGLEADTGLAIAAAAGLAAYGISFRAQKRLVAREERELLPLLRMLIEYARSMPDKPVAELLERAAATVAEPLASAARAAARGVMVARSWLARYTLYTITRIVGALGGSDPVALEKLYDLVYTHVSAYRAAGLRLRVLGFIAVGFPPVIVAAAKALQRVAAELVVPGIHVQGVVAVIEWLALASAAVMGFITAKAVSLTVRDTLWPLAAVAATLAATLML